MIKTKRSIEARRSWLFLPGAECDVLAAAPGCGADVLIQELEDFTPPERRPEARSMSPRILAGWNASPCLSAVRINPLEDGGLEDLEAVMQGRPAIVMMAMVTSAGQVRGLENAVGRLERQIGIPEGATEIVPNIETARGLTRIADIAAASRRVSALLLAAEDMAADLGAERTPEGHELAYVRSRFLVECVAAGVLAIDCPYTYADPRHLHDDIRFARRIGYKAKSVVNRDQVGTVNDLLTPSADEVARARTLVEAFEAARAKGLDRVDVEGLMVEVPTYRSAKRLLARHAGLSGQDAPG
ncbi:HpcH/HpaI aldolase/citrate lyase family protein [Microvirga pudoricolor]|uniref:HpcH/HpaI aldolase/citrate lyase family protein n=1 Tax=Microvirga pudoricolor TaxID=2778729 RepID=UPI00194E635A|nr:CoA ester lyase [Microvirga pudoricolor]MBM6593492.1 CoA ester lyase [Microvirga pudoricolor]